MACGVSKGTDSGGLGMTRGHGMGVPGYLDDKESARNAGDLSSIPGLGRFPWRRKWCPTPVFLPGKSHGQRSLVAYSPWSCRVGHDSGTNTYTHRSRKEKQNIQHQGQWNRSLTREQGAFSWSKSDFRVCKHRTTPHMVSSQIPRLCPGSRWGDSTCRRRCCSVPLPCGQCIPTSLTRAVNRLPQWKMLHGEDGFSALLRLDCLEV